MCEFTDNYHKQKVFEFMRGKASNEVITPQIRSRFPYALQRGICPVCGKVLLKQERKPMGRATRSMCRRCYEELIAARINTRCFVCAKPLPSYKIEDQYDNPREVANHIHDGSCIHTWTLIHNVAVTESEQPEIKSLHDPRQQSIPYTSMIQDRQKNIPRIPLDVYEHFRTREKAPIRSQVPRTYRDKPVKILLNRE